MKLINGTIGLKNIQLGILKVVDSFCRENNIKYFMCGGTLIGAVRHRGYIPWDDDIDVMMLRDDYERFIIEFSKVSGPYKVLSHKLQPEYPHAYAKVSDERTIMIEQMNNSIVYGINIDLFPIDDLPDDVTIVKSLFAKSEKMNKILVLKQVTLSKKRFFFKNLALLIGRTIYSCMSVPNIIQKLEDNATKYHGCKGSKCADLVAGFGVREIQNRSNLSETIEMQFEDQKFLAPKGYDAYLTGMYGDYMQLPPIEKQVSHHEFNAYWKE